MNRIVLLGGGGHASDLLGAFESAEGLEPLGFLDDEPAPRRLERFARRGLPHLGPIAGLGDLDGEVEYLIAVGYPSGRRAVFEQVRHLPHRSTRLIHPTADVGSATSFGPGAVVLAGARVSPGALIAQHVHVSYLAAVGHDAVIGGFSTVMPGAIVSGDVVVGEGVLIGSNATVLEGLSIGSGAQVGAGAVVVEDVEAGATVVGAPARERRA